MNVVDYPLKQRDVSFPEDYSTAQRLISSLELVDSLGHVESFCGLTDYRGNHDRCDSWSSSEQINTKLAVLAVASDLKGFSLFTDVVSEITLFARILRRSEYVISWGEQHIEKCTCSGGEKNRKRRTTVPRKNFTRTR